MATQTSASMTVTQQMVASIEAKDTEGNPTDPNTVVWTSSDETIAVVVPQAGGYQASIIAGAPGQCKIVVNANATKGGKGARPVLGVLNLTVTSGDVAEVTIKTEAPVEQGTAPDQGLPSRPARPSQGLPSQPNLPNQGLPGSPNVPSTGVPPNLPGQALPGGPPNRPDAGLPGSQPGIDAGLPEGRPNRPGQGLPPTPEPKRR
jgi:hypothetical protein